MKNPFTMMNLSKDKDKVKELYKKNIEKEAWNITKKVISRQLKLKDIQKFELMYEQYFKKYPDDKAEKNSLDRIKKLKTMVR